MTRRALALALVAAACSHEPSPKPIDAARPAPPVAAAARPADAGAAEAIAVALPDGSGGIGFDDLRFSRRLGRVLVPAGRTGNLDLIEPATRAVRAVGGFRTRASFGGGHGQGTTSVDDGGALLYATDRDARELVVVDPVAGKIVESARLAGSPDYVRWVDSRREVWVTEPDRAQIEVFAVDAAGAKPHAIATIAVAGGPESLVIDDAGGRAYTHLWQRESVAIDLTSHKLVAHFANGCADSRGIALDAAHGWLMAGCDEGKATLIDLATAKVTATAPTGKGVDIIAYDPARQRLFAPGGDDATLTVLDVKAGALTVRATRPVAKDSHCVVVDGDGGAWVCDPAGGRLLYFSGL